MRRQLVLGALAAIAAACTESTSPAISPNSPNRAAVPIDQSANPLDIAVIGDVPYGDAALAEFPRLVDAIDRDPKVRVAVHVGDIKSGDTQCSDEWYERMSAEFTRFDDPLVYAIGDNEWTDCHRANNGGYLPLERLAKLREIFFANPGTTLGGRNTHVEAEPGFPENQLWVESRVTFSALHVIGSNNGLAPWFGGAETPEQTASREAEVAARNAANIAWLEHAFAVAREQGSVGVALFFQADMRGTGAGFTAHTAFVRRLAELAAEFGGPVLLVSGDSHDLRVDAGVPWFANYGATPPANVTQIIVDRSIEDDIDYLRLHVDPSTPGVFSWEQVVVR